MVSDKRVRGHSGHRVDWKKMQYILLAMDTGYVHVPRLPRVPKSVPSAALAPMLLE